MLSRDHATTGSSSCNSHLKLHGGTHVLTHAAHGNPRGGLGRAAMYMRAVTLWPSLAVDHHKATLHSTSKATACLQICTKCVGIRHLSQYSCKEFVKDCREWVKENYIYLNKEKLRNNNTFALGLHSRGEQDDSDNFSQINHSPTGGWRGCSLSAPEVAPGSCMSLSRGA